MSPELEYLEGQFAAQLPYGVSARILKTVLPLERATSITSWKRRVNRIGDRLDREAHDALPIEPQVNEFGLPKRHPLQAIGNDGAYVNATDAPSRQEGWFEVIVGKSLPRQHTGNVHTALQVLEDLTWDVDTESEAAKSFLKRLEELMDYITANLAAIPTTPTGAVTMSPSRPVSPNRHSQPGRLQAHGQKAADEMDTARRACAAAGPRTRAQPTAEAGF